MSYESISSPCLSDRTGCAAPAGNAAEIKSRSCVFSVRIQMLNESPLSYSHRSCARTKPLGI